MSLVLTVSALLLWSYLKCLQSLCGTCRAEFQSSELAVIHLGSLASDSEMLVLGLPSKVLVVGELQGWPLCEAARSFPYVQWSQCQPATRQTHH